MPDQNQPGQNDLLEATERLIKHVEENNRLMSLYIESQTSFRRRVIAGLWTGLGTVVGATVMVSVLVLALKPLANVQWISPIVKKVIDDLETRQPITKSPPANR
jgi:hypothetical protein